MKNLLLLSLLALLGCGAKTPKPVSYNDDFSFKARIIDNGEAIEFESNDRYKNFEELLAGIDKWRDTLGPGWDMFYFEDTRKEHWIPVVYVVYSNNGRQFHPHYFHRISQKKNENKNESLIFIEKGFKKEYRIWEVSILKGGSPWTGEDF